MKKKKNKIRIRKRYHLRFGGWVYLGVSGFIALAAFNSQTNLLFWTFGLTVSVFLVSIIISSASIRGLRVQRLLPDHGVADEPLMLRYELTNQNWIMPCFGLIITELDGAREGELRGKPHGLVMHLGARATVQAEAIGYPSRRGPVDFDRIRIFTAFPFGIIRKSATVSMPGRTVIYPAIFRLRREMLWDLRSQEPAGTRRTHDAGGSEEFYGIREYREGDSIKFVDWKHSARLGHLVSRDMTRLTPPKLMVVLNLNRKDRGATEDAEQAISFVASLICEAHLDGFEVGMMVEGAPAAAFPPHHSRWHRTRMLHTLGEIDLTRDPEQHRTPQIPTGTHWAVVHTEGIDKGVGPVGAVHLTHDQLDQWKLFGHTQAHHDAHGHSVDENHDSHDSADAPSADLDDVENRDAVEAGT